MTVDEGLGGRERERRRSSKEKRKTIMQLAEELSAPRMENFLVGGRRQMATTVAGGGGGEGDETRATYVEEERERETSKSSIYLSLQIDRLFSVTSNAMSVLLGEPQEINSILSSPVVRSTKIILSLRRANCD